MNVESKKVLIVSLNDDYFEIEQLAFSLDFDVKKIFIQKRKNPDVNSYIGYGKVKEIKDFIDEVDYKIDFVIIDGELKPSQWFNLEKEWDIFVYDRVRLILAIFEERADRKEAKLQVKLASLEYEKPFVRELIHRARSGEHPGFMAGGEYQVDDYYEMIKKQTKKIKGNLKKISVERGVRRVHRHIGGFYLVSLSGYTNAGKSSLLNVLSGEKVKVEGRLFSTLSTTTRRLKNEGIPILLTDTVGFIDRLPALIIDAFHSTLEEIELADVVLLVVDISDSFMDISRKLKVALDELLDLGVSSPVIIVLNKSDLLDDREVDLKREFVCDLDFVDDKEIISISANQSVNIKSLVDLICDSLPFLSFFKLELPITSEVQSFISWLYEKSMVLSVTYKDLVYISLKCNAQVKDIIISKCLELDGSIIEE